MAKPGGMRVTIDAEGVNETLRALRRYAKETNTGTGELRDAAMATAADLAAKTQRALSADSDPRSPVLAVTVKVRRATTPSYTVGGSRRLFSSGTDSYPTPAGRVLFGTEFGANASSPGGYRTHSGQRGYVVFPTLRANEDVTIRNYRRSLDAMAHRWGIGG